MTINKKNVVALVIRVCDSDMVISVKLKIKVAPFIGVATAR